MLFHKQRTKGFVQYRQVRWCGQPGGSQLMHKSLGPRWTVSGDQARWAHFLCRHRGTVNARSTPKSIDEQSSQLLSADNGVAQC